MAHKILTILLITLIKTILSQRLSEIQCNAYSELSLTLDDENYNHLGRIETEEYFYGVATIITPRYVITVAEHLHQYSNEEYLNDFYFILFDEQHPDKNPVLRVYAHPQYQDNIRFYNFALAELNEMKPYYRFACISQSVPVYNEENFKMLSDNNSFKDVELKHTYECFAEILINTQNGTHLCAKFDTSVYRIGFPVQITMNDTTYISSISVLGENDMISGINLFPVIKWIESVAWPEYNNLKYDSTFCMG